MIAACLLRSGLHLADVARAADAKKRSQRAPSPPHTGYSLHSMPMSPPQARMILRRTVTRSRMIDRS